MSTDRPRTMHGARVLVVINGRVFGRCTGFSWNYAAPRKKIRTIDIPHPVELAATTVDITWQMGVIRTVGDGGMQGAGILAPPQQVIREKYFSLILIERATGLPIFRTDLCNTDGENWTIPTKGLMSGSVSGSGILYENEVGP